MLAKLKRHPGAQAKQQIAKAIGDQSRVHDSQFSKPVVSSAISVSHTKEMTMSTYDSDFIATGQQDLGYAFFTDGIYQAGANISGKHVGVQGNALLEGTNFGVIGLGAEAGAEWFPTYGNASVGVWGTSKNGPGVAGTSQNSPGLHGISSLDSGVVGQQGDGILPIGGTAGVVGLSQNLVGVSGVSTLGTGVAGRSDEGAGIFGHSDKSVAILGTAGEGFGYAGGPPTGIVGTSGGPSPIPFVDPNSSVNPPPVSVLGTSIGVVAVAGVASNSSGVIGQSGARPIEYGVAKAGVIGASHDVVGVHGVSDVAAGVYGTSQKAAGVSGSGVTCGVYGSSDNNPGVRGDSVNSWGLVGSIS
jgi:hypothetical protein